MRNPPKRPGQPAQPPTDSKDVPPKRQQPAPMSPREWDELQKRRRNRPPYSIMQP